MALLWTWSNRFVLFGLGRGLILSSWTSQSQVQNPQSKVKEDFSHKFSSPVFSTGDVNTLQVHRQWFIANVSISYYLWIFV